MNQALDACVIVAMARSSSGRFSARRRPVLVVVRKPVVVSQQQASQICCRKCLSVIDCANVNTPTQSSTNATEAIDLAVFQQIHWVTWCLSGTVRMGNLPHTTRLVRIAQFGACRNGQWPNRDVSRIATVQSLDDSKLSLRLTAEKPAWHIGLSQQKYDSIC